MCTICRYSNPVIKNFAWPFIRLKLTCIWIFSPSLIISQLSQSFNDSSNWKVYKCQTWLFSSDTHGSFLLAVNLNALLPVCSWFALHSRLFASCHIKQTGACRCRCKWAACAWLPLELSFHLLCCDTQCEEWNEEQISICCDGLLWLIISWLSRQFNLSSAFTVPSTCVYVCVQACAVCRWHRGRTQWWTACSSRHTPTWPAVAAPWVCLESKQVTYTHTLCKEGPSWLLWSVARGKHTGRSSKTFYVHTLWNASSSQG